MQPSKNPWFRHLKNFWQKYRNLLLSFSGLIDITKCETEILQLVLDGLKNGEIADKLTISERTVEFHKQNIYLKLKANNVVDLYKAALRLNLIHEKSSFY